MGGRGAGDGRGGRVPRARSAGCSRSRRCRRPGRSCPGTGARGRRRGPAEGGGQGRGSGADVPVARRVCRQRTAPRSCAWGTQEARRRQGVSRRRRRTVTSSPLSRRMRESMAVVVVFPCVPATAITSAGDGKAPGLRESALSAHAEISSCSQESQPVPPREVLLRRENSRFLGTASNCLGHGC